MRLVMSKGEATAGGEGGGTLALGKKTGSKDGLYVNGGVIKRQELLNEDGEDASKKKLGAITIRRLT